MHSKSKSYNSLYGNTNEIITENIKDFNNNNNLTDAKPANVSTADAQAQQISELLDYLFTISVDGDFHNLLQVILATLNDVFSEKFKHQRDISANAYLRFVYAFCKSPESIDKFLKKIGVINFSNITNNIFAGDVVKYTIYNLHDLEPNVAARLLFAPLIYKFCNLPTKYFYLLCQRLIKCEKPCNSTIESVERFISAESEINKNFIGVMFFEPAELFFTYEPTQITAHAHNPNLDNEKSVNNHNERSGK